MLATEPKHQHHGAGTMLLEEILAEADDAGVEVYLEATDTAKPLYERHGFEAITELRFSPGEYGVKGLGTERQTVMVRGALDRNGYRHPVRSWDVAVAHSKWHLQQQ
jgi:GNAT superfamily N-acetyltransferase